MMEAKSAVIPVPSTPVLEVDEKRLWVGNLDSRITEYQLIKLLQKYGHVLKFDFLFHKSGPLQGQPRGYCFVTYETREQAKRALQALDGTLAFSKRISVKWAHLKLEDEDDLMINSTKQMSGISSSVLQSESDLSISTKIRAIEAKLKLMEEEKDSDGAIPSLLLPLPNGTCSQMTTSQNHQPRQRTLLRHQSKPYHRHNAQRRSGRTRRW